MIRQLLLIVTSDFVSISHITCIMAWIKTIEHFLLQHHKNFIKDWTLLLPPSKQVLDGTFFRKGNNNRKRKSEKKWKKKASVCVLCVSVTAMAI